MPVSKKRKKKGKVVRGNRHLEELGSGGVTMQDLINMVAYQEYQQAGVIDNVAIPDTSQKETEEQV